MFIGPIIAEVTTTAVRLLGMGIIHAGDRHRIQLVRRVSWWEEP